MQDGFSCWLQSCPTKKRKTHKTTASCLRKFLPPFQKPGRIFTDNSQEFTKACQDLQWKPDPNTPQRSETNGVAKRAVRRVEEGTRTAMFQSGLPVNLWDCARECCCYFRNAPDKMANGTPACVKKQWCRVRWTFDPVRSERSTTSPPLQKRDEDNISEEDNGEYFWSMSGRIICRHHEVHRAKLYILDEATFPSPSNVRLGHEANENEHR